MKSAIKIILTQLTYEEDKINIFYLIVGQDAYTKKIYCKIIDNTVNSLNIVNFLIEILNEEPSYSQLFTDSGPEYDSIYLDLFLVKNNILHIYTQTNAKESLGQGERCVQIIKKRLRASSFDIKMEKNNLTESVKTIAEFYNKAHINATTKEIPDNIKYRDSRINARLEKKDTRCANIKEGDWSFVLRNIINDKMGNTINLRSMYFNHMCKVLSFHGMNAKILFGNNVFFINYRFLRIPRKKGVML